MSSFAFSKLDHSRRPVVMGVLNVTPDSFSDGGAYVDPGQACEHALAMIAEGADIIDIGAESTRPGSAAVAADEQIRRAIPVIKRVRAANPDVTLSLDTQLAEVAAAGLDAGVDVINDISALRSDPSLAAVVAQRNAGLVLMHMQGTPETMQMDPRYEDVVCEVREFLIERAHAAQDLGIPFDRMAIDPGIGFGKTLEHNLVLLASLGSFVETGYPVLLGASRKGFIQKIDESAVSADDRLGGSLACIASAIDAGVAIVRVHDVRATRQMIDVLSTIKSAQL